MHDILHRIAVVYIGLCLFSAAWTIADMYAWGHRQPMKVMEAVWPLTMLYWGPVGLAAYYWFGRPHPGREARGKPPMWQAVFKGASHCGAGCALGDFIGDWIAFLCALTLFGSELAGKIAAGFAFAYVLGIAFQYFSVAPMRHLGVAQGLWAAVKIDTVSLVAYEIGMFAWMALRTAVYPDLKPTQASYWFMMQIAMIVGFGTTYPVNWWLIRRGIKERM
ncbi:DUF4396 domain-containing protein [Bordetella genomosp. 11]|uniref:DUF4396 domain-containing protein n=1 Tax=Bordetella genomosp. 11 TaxID=1416808 RepID=A0A261UKI6_9BORD|nr:DUF4396 domain-containing protein [Bordetella genomosp. 11]OZI61790.1 hypothetical protein CAL28_21320 [Bordetella genomosp. 11]